MFNVQTGELVNSKTDPEFISSTGPLQADMKLLGFCNSKGVHFIKLRQGKIKKTFNLEELDNYVLHVTKKYEKPPMKLKPKEKEERHLSLESQKSSGKNQSAGKGRNTQKKHKSSFEHIYLLSQTKEPELTKLLVEDLLKVYDKKLGDLTQAQFVSNNKLVGVCSDVEKRASHGTKTPIAKFGNIKHSKIVMIRLDLFDDCEFGLKNKAICKIADACLGIRKFEYKKLKDRNEVILYILQDYTVRMSKFKSRTKSRQICINFVERDRFVFRTLLNKIGSIEELLDLSKNLNTFSKGENDNTNYPVAKMIENSLNGGRNPEHKKHSYFWPARSEQNFICDLSSTGHFEFGNVNAEFLWVSKDCEEFVIYCESHSYQSQTNKNQFILTVSVKYDKDIFHKKTYMNEFYIKDKNKHIKILNIGGRPTKQDPTTREFLIYSPREVLHVVFDCEHRDMHINKRKSLRIEKDLEIKYFEAQKLLFIPDDHFLEMWHESLSYKVHSFELDLRIKFFKLIPSENSLIIGDKNT